jgi:NDP-sugar pyrophosphorylase family protein
MTAHSPADYLDMRATAHTLLFPPDEPVWTSLSRIESYLEFRLRREIRSELPPGIFLGEQVFIDDFCVLEPGVVIKGPAWIGKNCVIRAGAYLRENVIVGNGCTIGNSSELKNCVLFDECEVPHFNYVGDSVLGRRAHLGAGVVLSNVRLDRREVLVREEDRDVPTGLRKFGAVVGDEVEIGCNSVINPGSLIGPRSIIYPLSNFTGVLPANSILKTRQSSQIIRRG